MDRRAFVVRAAGLALAPRHLFALAAPPQRALVTADLESRLVVVDLASGKTVGHIPTLSKPRSIESVGGMAVVAHSEIGVVSLVNAKRLRVARVLHNFGEPRYTAGHPDGRHAYVSDAKRGQVTAVDVIEGRVLARATVGPRARHITIDPSGRTLWVALGSKAEQIAVVDVSRPARPRFVRRFRPPFLAHDVGWSPDGRRVWVSSGDALELAVYDARSGRGIARPNGDFPPQHVTFARGLAVVTSGWSGTLRVHHTDGRSISRTRVPVGSYNVQRGLGRIVTPSLERGSICILDERGRVLRTRTIARSCHDACVIASA
jgi:hypothetical protein